MRTNIRLRCIKHSLTLTRSDKNDRYVCQSGCIFPIVNSIPRFASETGYVRSFGLQWNAYRTAQLDSFNGTTISRQRLERMLGDHLNTLKDKQVLEAGCGAGRFTELLLAAGADVFAADLSDAVEANYDNCSRYPNYYVCQADILLLPVWPAQFDVVVCIGVVQHTPNPEETMRALCSYLKPGGILIMDHYTHGYAMTCSRRILRSWLLRMSPDFSLVFCKLLVSLMWPMHRVLWKLRSRLTARIGRRIFLRLSPVLDYLEYQEVYPHLGEEKIRTWAMLDTHDTLTDFYKHLRSAEEISQHLRACGMIDIEPVYAGNGVEVRARRPVDNACIGGRIRKAIR
jgi:2-polyprenyl-3-methyl-5-hydroxy-6-metoxy-1,4-benzoquinol methylase